MQLTMSMSAVSSQVSAARVPSAKTIVATLCRRILPPMLVAAVLMGGYGAYFSLQSPGEVIRHDLTRAGSRVARLPWSTPREHVQQSVSRYFASYPATVDPAGFPSYVRVTLRDLNSDVCRDAYRKAARIEGEVVIEIEGRGGDMACHDQKTITWRIMP